MAKGKFRIKDDRGLFTEPSLEIVRCARTFESEIYLTYQKKSVSAKSLLSILMLTATQGALIEVKASGVDEAEAVQSLLTLACNNFLLLL